MNSTEENTMLNLGLKLGENLKNSDYSVSLHRNSLLMF